MQPVKIRAPLSNTDYVGRSYEVALDAIYDLLEGSQPIAHVVRACWWMGSGHHDEGGSTGWHLLTLGILERINGERYPTCAIPNDGRAASNLAQALATGQLSGSGAQDIVGSVQRILEDLTPPSAEDMHVLRGALRALYPLIEEALTQRNAETGFTGDTPL